VHAPARASARIGRCTHPCTNPCTTHPVTLRNCLCLCLPPASAPTVQTREARRRHRQLSPTVIVPLSRPTRVSAPTRADAHARTREGETTLRNRPSVVHGPRAYAHRPHARRGRGRSPAVAGKPAPVCERERDENAPRACARRAHIRRAQPRARSRPGALSRARGAAAEPVMAKSWTLPEATRTNRT
jgi:hypothetical protein